MRFSILIFLIASALVAAFVNDGTAQSEPGAQASCPVAGKEALLSPATDGYSISIPYDLGDAGLEPQKVVEHGFGIPNELVIKEKQAQSALRFQFIADISHAGLEHKGPLSNVRPTMACAFYQLMSNHMLDSDLDSAFVGLTKGKGSVCGTPTGDINHLVGCFNEELERALREGPLDYKTLRQVDQDPGATIVQIIVRIRGHPLDEQEIKDVQSRYDAAYANRKNKEPRFLVAVLDFSSEQFAETESHFYVKRPEEEWAETGPKFCEANNDYVSNILAPAFGNFVKRINQYRNTQLLRAQTLRLLTGEDVNPNEAQANKIVTSVITKNPRYDVKFGNSSGSTQQGNPLSCPVPLRAYLETKPVPSDFWSEGLRFINALVFPLAGLLLWAVVFWIIGTLHPTARNKAEEKVSVSKNPEGASKS